jgi:hypothetical protein
MPCMYYSTDYRGVPIYFTSLFLRRTAYSACGKPAHTTLGSAGRLAWIPVFGDSFHLAP